jgi:hypothetical protein
MKCMSLRRLRGRQFVSTLPSTLLPWRRQSNSKWTRCLWRISTVAVGILTLSSTLVAQHYYVSPDGNDNNSGTSTSSPLADNCEDKQFHFPGRQSGLLSSWADIYRLPGFQRWQCAVLFGIHALHRQLLRNRYGYDCLQL